MKARAAPGGPPCQLGMLASLRRVQPEQAGRVVLVSSTANPIVSASGKRLPAWRVHVMGAPIVIGEDEHSDFVVAEACLQLFCRLPLPAARKLYLAKAHRDFDDALAELGRWLARNPVDENELDAELNACAREAVARHRGPPVLLPVGW